MAQGLWSNSINRRLAPKLMRELKPGARVVSRRFDMYDWRPDQEWKTYFLISAYS